MAKKTSSGNFFPATRDSGKKTLVLLLHGFNPRKTFSETTGAIRAFRPDADVLVPDMPTRPLSFATPDGILDRLLGILDAAWRKKQAETGGKGYAELILVGYSLGAAFARKLYLLSVGEPTAFEPFREGSAPLKDKVKPWGSAVSRLILLAGLNRGWSVTSHMDKRRLLVYAPCTWFGHLVNTVFGKPLIFHFRKGASFMTALRLQWVAMEKRVRSGAASAPKVIQLVGSRDDLVGPHDDIDLVSGGRFTYVDIPDTGHFDAFRMDARPDGTPGGDPAARERARIFRLALGSSDPRRKASLDRRLDRLAMVPSDEDLRIPDPAVTDVVFVVHGIRDKGYWTGRVARRIVEEGRSAGRTFRTVTSSYGYFPMLPFLFPARRREKVEWLMERYAEARHAYPSAGFSFVGHSHGTYLLAKAMQEYPMVSFKHVVFGGSVVRTDYAWDGLIAAKRIGGVLNFAATGDLVVAIFPKAMQVLRIQDLGSAGHDGFAWSKSPSKLQYLYVPGGHGAMVDESSWKAIAEFVVHGKESTGVRIEKNRKLYALLLGYWPPLVWLAILGLLGWAGYGIVAWLREEPGWMVGALVLYGWFLKTILTRV